MDRHHLLRHHSYHGDWVVRPFNHSRGRNLDVVSSTNVRDMLNGEWYARPLIDKQAETRVYVVNGRVAAVANKTPPSDRTQVAWNHALGSEFTNVKWGRWSFLCCERAIEAARMSGLSYAAVDMMQDQDGEWWVIEINSAGSLPRNDDGSPSYRARCVANSLAFHYTNNSWDWMSPAYPANWRDLIHPGVWSTNRQPEGASPEFRSTRTAVQ